MKKALLYRKGALGDTLLTFPVLEWLKESGFFVVASGNFDYFKLAKEGFTQKVNNLCDEVFHEKPILEDFDFIVDISIESSIKPFPDERVHIVKHYFRSLNVEFNFSRKIQFRDDIKSPFADKVVVHFGSSSVKKIPSFEFLEKMINLFDKRAIFTIGESDSFLEPLLYNKNIFYIEDLLYFAKAIQKAKYYVGFDSGISHLASYIGLKSLIIFGPSDKEVFAPLGENTKIFSLDVSCSPCKEFCEERYCLNDKNILKAIKDFLEL